MRPGLWLHAKRAHQRQLISALIMWMALDLIDHRTNARVHAEIEQTVRQKIADADGAHLASVVEILQRPPGAVVIAEGHVNEIEIEMVEAERHQRTVKRLHRVLVAHLVDVGFVVMNSSSRGTPQPAIARPTAASF